MAEEEVKYHSCITNDNINSPQSTYLINFFQTHQVKSTTFKMLFKSLLFAVCAVATASCTTHGTFKSPKSESFVTIELYLDRSVNLTTPDGAAALVPIRGGEIKGQFNGFVVQNLTASTERVKFDSEGGEYSVRFTLFLQYRLCSVQSVQQVKAD
jgi:hypothetical protein